MTLPPELSRRLRLPVVCAPMFLISNPTMVIAACKAGTIGAFPLQNTRSRAEFTQWLRHIRETLDAWEARTGKLTGPVAVNIPTTRDTADIVTDLELCASFGVSIIITSAGKPDVVTAFAHERGLLVHHDVTTMEFARKAINAGVDGLNCIGAGGGGHSGTISHLAFIPKVRTIFDGTISLAGAVASGAAIRAAEALGADLAFVGTRFAATEESGADPLQKDWLVTEDSRSLGYTNRVNGVHANWLLPSLERFGIDVDALPAPTRRGRDHLPSDVSPWRDLWSAGHGIEIIDDVPTIDSLVARLRTEYLAAAALPHY